jgi:DNA-binding PadR family transcriptional regulator
MEPAMAKPRARLLVLNDPYPMRISSELAQEIGLDESIVLLQLEYLISISAHERDGILWTRQSLTELHDKYFGWWSVPTISRVLKSLEKMGLVKIENYNKHGYDRTQWFALNSDGINNLHSVAIFQNEKSIIKECKMHDQDLQNASDQNETTIPETTGETTEKREGTYHPAVSLYFEFYPNQMLGADQKAEIEKRISDLKRWRSALSYWKNNRYRPQSITKMCDRYDEEKSVVDSEKKQREATEARYWKPDENRKVMTGAEAAEYAKKVGRPWARKQE